MKPTYTQVTRTLMGRGYSTDADGKWRLPHSLYQPTTFEAQCLLYLIDGRVTEGFSDEAKSELRRQREKRLLCRLGIHAFGGWVREMGPQTAIQMNQRSGVMVAIYSGEWRTCFCCGNQQIRGGFPDR